MEMKKVMTVSNKAFFIDGVPKLFATPIDSLEHLDSWIHTPQEVNPEAEAYACANDDGEDHGDDTTISYDCIAWQ